MISCFGWNLRIIYEDDTLIAVDKPSGMLSVPGKEFRALTFTRVEQWSQVISTFLKSQDATSSILPVLKILEEQSDKIPRQDQKFFRYMKRSHKSLDEESIGFIWSRLQQIDKELYGGLPEGFPFELISAADLVDYYYGQKVFHVHRLDQETSGVLIFAKTSSSAANLSEQFRNHQVESSSKCFLKRFHGINIDSETLYCQSSW